MLAIVLGTLCGAYYRAFASAIFAATAVCGFFLVALLGPPLTELLGGVASAPEYLLRLTVFLVVFFGVLLGGLLGARSLWMLRNVPLVAPVDRGLGLLFGFIGGSATAGYLSIVCFTLPFFDAALYPPESALSSHLNFSGPDPILHAPYRAMQVGSAFDRLTGGTGYHPGKAGAWLTSGPVGARFHETYVRAEELKESQPIQALKAWEAFQSEPLGSPEPAKRPSAMEELSLRPWLSRAAEARADLKPFLEERADEFFTYVRRDCIGAGDLDALERAIQDGEQMLPEHPETQMLQALTQFTGPIRGIREKAEGKPQLALNSLRTLLSGPDVNSFVRLLIAREMRAATGQSVPGVAPSSTKDKSLKEQALQAADRYQFTKTLQLLKRQELETEDRDELQKVKDYIFNFDTINDLHLRAVEAINKQRPKKALPRELELGEGTIESATASYLAMKVAGKAEGKSWSQFTSRQVRSLYVLFLGADDKGLQFFDWYFR